MVIPLAIFLVSFCGDATCKTGFDSLTKSMVYITSETMPVNEGGQAALMQKLNKISISNVPENYDPNFLVAFIVDTYGSIKGERILRDNTNEVGNQMLNIVRLFKWTPGTCNHKKVKMIYKLPLIIDISVQ